MKNWKHAVSSLNKLMMIAALTALFTGCGGTAYDLAGNNGGLTGGITPTSTPTPTPTSTSTSTGTNPPLTFTGSITGSTGTTPSWTSPAINTDNVLQIRVTPGPAGKISTGTTGVDSYFTGNYNCASYDIVVLGQTTSTNVIALNPSGPCWDSTGTPMSGTQGSQVIDYSARLSPGHGPITITVQGTSRTDAYCQWLATNIYNPFSTAYYQFSWIPLFCPVKPIYKTHVATFNLSVAIDGTTAP